MASSDSTMINIQPVGDVTIQSEEGILLTGGKGELREGPQSTWNDNILLEYDVTSSSLSGNNYQAATYATLCVYVPSSSPTGRWTSLHGIAKLLGKRSHHMVKCSCSQSCSWYHWTNPSISMGIGRCD